MQDSRFDSGKFISHNRYDFQNDLYSRGASQSRTSIAKSTFGDELLGSNIGGQSCGGSSKGDSGILERFTGHYINDGMRSHFSSSECTRHEPAVARMLNGPIRQHPNINTSLFFNSTRRAY